MNSKLLTPDHPSSKASLWRSLCIATLALAPFISPASNAQLAGKPVDCGRVEKGYGSNFEMTVCADRSSHNAKQRLQKLLNNLRTAMPEGFGRKALEESQAAWMAWKNKEAQLCANAMAGYSPEGSGFDMQVSYCSTKLTNERIAVLQKYLGEVKSR